MYFKWLYYLGFTPLLDAARGGKTETVKFLLSIGSSLEEKSNYGKFSISYLKLVDIYINVLKKNMYKILVSETTLENVYWMFTVLFKESGVWVLLILLSLT